MKKRTEKLIVQLQEKDEINEDPKKRREILSKKLTERIYDKNTIITTIGLMCRDGIVRDQRRHKRDTGCDEGAGR